MTAKEPDPGGDREENCETRASSLRIEAAAAAESYSYK